MKPLQVWGWSDWQDNSTQTHEIMAARSKAEVARQAGVRSPARLWNLSVTVNADEIRQAMTEPGVIFWFPLSERSRNPRWRRRSAPSRYGPGKI